MKREMAGHYYKYITVPVEVGKHVISTRLKLSVVLATKRRWAWFLEGEGDRCGPVGVTDGCRYATLREARGRGELVKYRGLRRYPGKHWVIKPSGTIADELTYFGGPVLVQLYKKLDWVLAPDGEHVISKETGKYDVITISPLFTLVKPEEGTDCFVVAPNSRSGRVATDLTRYLSFDTMDEARQAWLVKHAADPSSNQGIYRDDH